MSFLRRCSWDRNPVLTWGPEIWALPGALPSTAGCNEKRDVVLERERDRQRERERGSEREGGRGRDRERERDKQKEV